VVDELRRAAGRGVRCRILVDTVGSKLFLRSALCGGLRECGASVTAALPANPRRMLLARVDLRNHRKIAVIDGRIGYRQPERGRSDFAIKPRFAWVDAMIRIEARVRISRALRAGLVPRRPDEPELLTPGCDAGDRSCRLGSGPASDNRPPPPGAVRCHMAQEG
jgi:hypothetical protein